MDKLKRVKFVKSPNIELPKFIQISNLTVFKKGPFILGALYKHPKLYYHHIYTTSTEQQNSLLGDKLRGACDGMGGASILSPTSAFSGLALLPKLTGVRPPK